MTVSTSVHLDIFHDLILRTRLHDDPTPRFLMDLANHCISNLVPKNGRTICGVDAANSCTLLVHVCWSTVLLVFQRQVLSGPLGDVPVVPERHVP